ncbi:MAG: helix-turn-helix domain-containing protein [Chloroflexota bacterium]
MIGERIRARRQDLGLSLRDLAQQVDLTASFLSQIERQVAEPSIKSLRKIANALQVPLFYFLAENGETNPVVRKNERKRLQLPRSKVICELLTPDLNHKMEMFMVSVDPCQDNIAHPLSQPTEECILVIEGRLCVKLGGAEYELEAGDSIYFEGPNLQSISAKGDKKTVFVSAMTPAVF